jgi:thioredoxin-dependent peroxiredoxin
LTGLLSRAIIVIDEVGTVIYTEQVSDITEEPNYDAALDVL